MTKSGPIHDGPCLFVFHIRRKTTNNKTTLKFLCCCSFGPQAFHEPLRNWSQNHSVCNTDNCYFLCTFIHLHPQEHPFSSPSVCGHDNLHKHMAKSDIPHAEETLFSSTAVAEHLCHFLCTGFSPHCFSIYVLPQGSQEFNGTKRADTSSILSVLKSRTGSSGFN